MNARQKRLRERRLIKLSILLGSILTVWAIAVGIAGDSKSIIFDALFSMIGISLSGVSLLVNNFIRKRYDDDLPFGRAQFQPFAITVQSSVIIFLCLYSLATSVMDMINGGKVVELDIALPYLVASIVICFGLWLYFGKKAAELDSEYVRVESTEWQLDALLSFGVLCGLSLGHVLKGTSISYLMPYLDPAMVAIISVIFLRVPVRTFWKNLRELLQFAPDDQVENHIHEVVEQISASHQFTECFVRVIKTGNSYTAEIDFLLPAQLADLPVSALDEIRQEVFEKISGNYEMWLTIAFTTQRKWII